MHEGFSHIMENSFILKLIKFSTIKIAFIIKCSANYYEYDNLRS